MDESCDQKASNHSIARARMRADREKTTPELYGNRNSLDFYFISMEEL